MRKKTKSQEKIDKAAVAAKRAGMSYGQYVALTECCGRSPQQLVSDMEQKKM